MLMFEVSSTTFIFFYNNNNIYNDQKKFLWSQILLRDIYNLPHRIKLCLVYEEETEEHSGVGVKGQG